MKRIALFFSVYIIILIVTTYFTIDIKSIDYFTGTVIYFGIVILSIQIDNK